MLLHACWIQAPSHVNIIEHLCCIQKPFFSSSSGIEMNFPSSVLAACREAHESTTFYIHPGRVTLQITHVERNMIFQTSMIMFHVNLPRVYWWCGLDNLRIFTPSVPVDINWEHWYARQPWNPSRGAGGNYPLHILKELSSMAGRGGFLFGYCSMPKKFFKQKRQEIFLVTLVYAELSCFFGH